MAPDLSGYGGTMNHQASDHDAVPEESVSRNAASRDPRATDETPVRPDSGARDAPPGERHGGHLPEGTATDVPPPEGTSVDAPKVQGIYRPDVGPGGADIDEGDRALPSRDRTARRPH
jgi:hypothetical protein